MHIELSSKGIPVSPEVREHIERRLFFALGRFTARLRGVRVRLADVNGPRGGVDKRCTIQVLLPRVAPVIVEEVHEHAPAAVDLAADRAGRAVARKLDRVTDWRRHPRVA